MVTRRMARDTPWVPRRLLAWRCVCAQAAADASLILRAIPSTGERLPIIGLVFWGLSRLCRSRAKKITRHCAPCYKMVELGGTVFDTAPSYGASEEVAGRIAQSLGIADKLFWATKLNVASRGGG